MYNLFLDDMRSPRDAFFYTGDVRFNLLDWIIVRTYDEFVKQVNRIGLPDLVSFDHDIADFHYCKSFKNISDYNSVTEKTGYHCAKWLVDYCIDNDLKLPKYIVHSMNPIGSENIISLLNNFKKLQNS